MITINKSLLKYKDPDTNAFNSLNALKSNSVYETTKDGGYTDIEEEYNETHIYDAWKELPQN